MVKTIFCDLPFYNLTNSELHKLFGIGTIDAVLEGSELG